MKEDFTTRIAELEKLIDRSHHTVIFTGAGISTLSGIPDFRSPNGVYSEKWHGLDVEEVLSIDFFRLHPEIFYEWAKPFVYSLEKYQPNVVHRVAARLEALGLCHGVYTQNIDQLHQRAGSRRVFELHGSAASYHCLNCRRKFKDTAVDPIVKRGDVPKCPNCGGLLKPDIVFYGESLDAEMLETADMELRRTELLLVLGSSLTVYPAAAMPEIAARSGGKVVIVNAQPTGLDRLATLRFDDLELVFNALETRYGKN
ncbi:MAG: NAD-dependent protein deacylase [Victivallaceae bacterium]|nr:NAD-dependent protein deacylase [Victivallaceae bacterium]